MLLKNKLENLKKSLKNDNVLAKLEERYCYSTDASNSSHDFKIPDLVVFVETIEDVKRVLKYANEFKVPIVPRGAGTNMVGACVTNKGGIVLNFSKMNKILEINPMNMYVKVQPGVVLGDLKKTVESYNLFYPPDPSNYKVSTVGGSIAQSSAGALSFKYGSTKDYVLSLTVVMADGRVLKLGSDNKKDSVGYHLNQLIVGSEGTLGIVVEATLKIIPKPEAISVLVAGFSNIDEMLGVIDKIEKSNIFPAAIDFMDKTALKTSNEYFKNGISENSEYLLLIQFDGDLASLEYQKNKVNNLLLMSKVCFFNFYETVEDIENVWNFRRVSYATVTRLAPDVISDDLIVTRDKVGDLITFCHNIAKEFELNLCLVGHIGDGNLHPQFALDIANQDEYKKYLTVKSLIYEKVIELKGNISGEHGIGLDKIKYLDKVVSSDTLDYMKMIKFAFDPNNILNPGKIFN